ncbi:5-(carboxyamino)imidazole ribonucleotide synthase [Terriglobus roseus]|uniref:N5-carboxyaminoimidazole ribonucleotide synthase n=1 Tax=Terriglobus roseus TaxID=392734 RepID=A0A1H4MVR4_9BACT|nr:5-(carboxyamino)imidazole ribonucleotide synthase [Terriglobus roseus]SEB87116.1 5-(carboxyamino)imidazole ribonucleotide synthase [Terriglobus roseus]
MSETPADLLEKLSGPVLPGGTIGIFGGGQLGRMMGIAARSMGYKVHVLDPDPACSAGYIADKVIEAGWNDRWAAANLARESSTVTLEIEQVSILSLDEAARWAPMRPGAAMLAVIQDRVEQKDWLNKHGFPTGPYRAVRSEAQLAEAVKALDGPVFVKSARGGYDGRGQAKLGFGGDAVDDAAIRQAWQDVGAADCVAERALSLAKEISVMVARAPNGEVKVYPPAENFHENQILSWSVIPASVPVELAGKAQKIAGEIADTFALEGLLAVEMFITTDGQLLVNELAPRPHNSYHGSERACTTGQFEQAIRAACDLPLGDVSMVQPTAIANLLGDVWLNDDGTEKQPAFDQALAIPGVKLILYEKLKPRKGRKMGHLSAVGATADEARERVLAAKARL